MRFIDPPSPFAPLDDWLTFLAEMQSIHDADDVVMEHIELAKRIIAEKRGE